MHLELPKAPLDSIRDFLKHYLMIVLSILTALGLEAWIERTHHAHAAEIAQAQIDTEIRSNLSEIQGSLAKNARQAKALASIRDSLVQDFKAHATDQAISRHIQSLVQIDGFNLNLSWPTLRREAWDVAVANQSVSWMNDAAMRRYSAVYAGQREMVTTLSANLALVMNGPRMVDAMTDLRTGNVDPHEFLHVIGQMTLMLDQARNNLGGLEDRLKEALVDAPSP